MKPQFDLQFYLDGSWQDQDIELADSSIEIMNVDQTGIIPGNIQEQHLDDTVFSFLRRGNYDVAGYLPKMPVRVLTEISGAPDQVLFTGIVVDLDHNGSVGDEGISYLCKSWWYGLSLFTIKLSGIPKLVYNARLDDPQYDVDRIGLTVQEILQDAFELIQSDLETWFLANFKVAWGGIAFGETLDVVPPKMTFDGATLQDVIKAALRWMPDVFLTIDRADGTLNFARRASTTAHNITLHNGDDPEDVTPVNSLRLKPRLDLAVPRLILHFPNRVERLEAWTDEDPAPDDIYGIPTTIEQITELQYRVSNYPMFQVLEVNGGGNFNVSLTSGVITFKQKPETFFVRYISEDSQETYDTGYGGSAYSAFNWDRPILERYLFDFPTLTRRFYLNGVDPDAATWFLSLQFAETYPDSDFWPDLIGKTVTIDGKGSSTIASVAVHHFLFTGLEATIIGGFFGIAAAGGFLSVNAVSFQLAGAIAGAARGDILEVLVEDSTDSISALADSLWKALRDVHYSGEIPAIRWMPELQIGHRINLLNTNDANFATMNEAIVGLTFEPSTGKTFFMIASSPWTDLDTLLGVIRQNIPPQSFQQIFNGGNGGSGSGGGEEAPLADHDHSAAGTEGGTLLKPVRIAMAGGTETDNEIRVGATGAIVVGTYPAGPYIAIAPSIIEIKAESKVIQIGSITGELQVRIDGLDYLFTDGSTRKLKAKVV